MLKTRVLSAIMLVLIFGAGLIYGGLFWWTLLLFISFLGYHEFSVAIRDNADGLYETDLLELSGFLCMIFYYISLYMNPEREKMPGMLIGAAVIYMVVFVAFYPEYDTASVMSSFFGLIYIPFMFSFLYLIREGAYGITGILAVVLSSWICDTFAYFTGVSFGKHKLTPVLSPHKSVEGAVGGTIASIIGGVILALLTHGTIWKFVILTGTGAVASQFGDLFASGLKRSRGIKDFGDLIPGHGGVLDRFDSGILAAPVVYYILMYF